MVMILLMTILILLVFYDKGLGGELIDLGVT